MDEELRRVVARRWRVGVALTAVMVIAYFAFLVLVAFDPADAGALIANGRVSVGIVLGALLIVIPPVLIAIYARWANRRYDPAIDAARARRGGRS
jgi:uncharacterized membrane protein (DUF485 family)